MLVASSGMALALLLLAVGTQRPPAPVAESSDDPPAVGATPEPTPTPTYDPVLVAPPPVVVTESFRTTQVMVPALGIT